MTAEVPPKPTGQVVRLFPDGSPDTLTFEPIGAVVERVVDEIAQRNGLPSAAEIVADRRFLQGVQHLHEQGPRAMAELLAEIGAERSIQTIIDRKVERFVNLSDDALQATGGDRLPPAPLTPIDGGRR